MTERDTDYRLLFDDLHKTLKVFDGEHHLDRMITMEVMRKKADLKQIYYNWKVKPHHYRHVFKAMSSVVQEIIVQDMAKFEIMLSEDFYFKDTALKRMYHMHDKREGELLRLLALTMQEWAND